MVRPRMQPSVNPVSIFLAAPGSIQLLFGPAVSLGRLADKGQVFGSGHIGGMAEMPVGMGPLPVIQFAKDRLALDPLLLDPDLDEPLGFLPGSIAPINLFRLSQTSLFFNPFFPNTSSCLHPFPPRINLPNLPSYLIFSVSTFLKERNSSSPIRSCFLRAVNRSNMFTAFS